MMLDNFSIMMGLPIFVIVLIALAEVGGSVLILAGGFLDKTWMTRIGAMMFVPVMLGAISMVHWGLWSFVTSETHKMGSMEFQVVLLLVSLYLVVKGNKA